MNEERVVIVTESAEAIARHLEPLVDEGGVNSWRALVDAATVQMARGRGVCVDDWVGDELGLVDALSRWPDELWEDPHALGWIHEQFAAAARRDSFAEHVHREKKHASSTVSTQLYTPRWIADALARETLGDLDEIDVEDVTVLDPAVGGAQMLLAAMAVFFERHPDEPQRWVQPLWGFDLDERAVEVARRTIALEIARRQGARCERCEEVAGEQIRVADGLVCGEDDGWTVVLTNPPYMGWRSMPGELREQLDPRFRPYHSDLFAAFIARCHELAGQAVGILAQQSIWYLRRFEKARRDLLEHGHLRSFLHLGAGAFWNLDGEKASVVAFVQSANSDEESKATKVWDLRGDRCPQEKRRAYELGEEAPEFSTFDVATTKAIPGRPICHDLPRRLRRLFAECAPLEQVAEVPSQNKTGRNREFVRRWDEVDPDELRRVDELGARGDDEGRWVFYSKGGRFAPWWGNWHWVVDWSDEARRFYDENRTSSLLDESFWFREGIVYTDFGGHRFNARWMPPGCVFDMTGPAIFPKSSWWPKLDERQRIGAAMAIVNSSPARRMLKALNPTLHFQMRDVRALPVPPVDEEEAAQVADKVWRLVEGVRHRHRHVEGDPLYSQEADEAIPVAKLVAWEEEIDHAICAAYGVERRPLAQTSVTFHHRLGR